MSSSRFCRVFAFGLIASFIFAQNAAIAQRNSKRLPRRSASGAADAKSKKGANKTTVIVEILTGADGLGLGGQSLRPLFENLGYSVRIRQGTSQDKVETREKVYGRLRDVIVVGRLDEKGHLVFADRTFSTSDTKGLKEWLRVLETYGAQGTPEGKPVWGMTDEQFKEVHKALAEKVAVDLSGKSFNEALDQLQLPAQFPLRTSVDATNWLKQTFVQMPVVKDSLKGCSKGTALAVLTNAYGMGFRPLRTPDGAVELVIDPLTKATDAWPIGWQSKAPENTIVPKFYQLDPVEFTNEKLTDRLKTIEAETGVPVRIDDFGIKTQGIDVETLRVSHKRGKAPLSLVLSRITVPHRLQHQFKLDEVGQPFVWISFLVPSDAAR